MRFIPAWAGNSVVPILALPVLPVHPRMGGELPSKQVDRAAADGSSPHGRGTLACDIHVFRNQRFIPAWAGNSGLSRSASSLSTVHPRMGGELSSRAAAAFARAGSSPHGRGTRRCPQAKSTQCRFIPAWAGNSFSGRAPVNGPPVHPRMGGELLNTHRHSQNPRGSSPHGRGTLARNPIIYQT